MNDGDAVVFFTSEEIAVEISRAFTEVDFLPLIEALLPMCSLPE